MRVAPSVVIGQFFVELRGLDEYLHAANCNLMPEKALRTAIGNAYRMKFIEREPKRLKDLPMQVGSPVSAKFHCYGL